MAQLETDIERFDSKELAAEIQRTNKLLGMYSTSVYLVYVKNSKYIFENF